MEEYDSTHGDVMTSIFGVTGPLQEESYGHQWISLTKDWLCDALAFFC